MRSRFTKLVTALFAVLAVTGLAATAAQAATEGPFVKVAGARLEAGKSKELKATGIGSYTMSGGSSVITCTNMSSGAGSKIVGSAVGKAATLEATFTFSGCTISGSPECKLTEVKTQPLVGTFALSEGKSRLEVLLKPASKKTFATFEDEGRESTCVGLASKVSGELVVALWGGEKEELVNVGKEPAEAHTLGIWASYPAPKIVWVEKTAVHVEELTEGGTGFAIAGRSTIELASNELWGVFT
jgi:hypothetical protein